MSTRDLAPPVLARHILYDASVLLGHSSRWHRPDKKEHQGFARNEHGEPVWSTDAFAVAWSAQGAIWRAGFEKKWIGRQSVDATMPQIVQIAELWLARGIDRFWRPPFISRFFYQPPVKAGEWRPPREEISADRWLPPAALIVTFEDFHGTTHADVRQAFACAVNIADRAIAEVYGDPVPSLLNLNQGAKAA